jgi:hypothetical protein
MNPRNKRESALGKGLDALIRKDYLDEEEKNNKRPETEKNKKTASETSLKTIKSSEDSKNEESIIAADEESNHQESASLKADEKIVETVLLEVNKNPRISLWSAKSAAVLRYLKKTKPEFSISSEASLLIEEAVKDRHPEIWNLFVKKGL